MAKKEAKKEITEKCNKFLNDVLNMVEPSEKLIEEFTCDITILDKKNARSIIEEYTDYSMILLSTYKDYRFNVENFERYVLRLNSVISSSLTIEYRINDILYNNKHIIDSMNKSFEHIEELKDIENINQNNIVEVLLKVTQEEYKNLYNSAIEKIKKDYYFIGNISKDKELKELILQICQTYIENELIKVVREDMYKKHKIVIKNELLKDKIHCLKIGAYKITVGKIAQLMNLSLQNYGKNVIDEETLKLFNVFLNFEDITNEQEYKEILSKYRKEAVKEIETKKHKYFTFEDMIKYYTILILKELRWRISE